MSNMDAELHFNNKRIMNVKTIKTVPIGQIIVTTKKHFIYYYKLYDQIYKNKNDYGK